jgi:class 3 adenylate cyclase
MPAPATTPAAPAVSAPVTPAAAPAPAPAEATRLGVETLRTAHALFAAFGERARSLTWLHGDLFDPRMPVVLSALEAVGTLAEPRSAPFVTRLLAATQEEEVRCAAVRCLGRLRHPDSVKLLFDLVKTTRSEKLRREILDALAAAAPQNRDVVALIRQIARSAMASAPARSHAAGLLLRAVGAIGLEELLADGREEVVDQILRSALEIPDMAPRVVAHYSPLYARLPARSRAALAPMALRQKLTESTGVLRAILADPHAEVRRAAYLVIGTDAAHAELGPALVDHLADSVEENPALEDEVQQALARLDKLDGVRALIPQPVRGKVMARIADLQKQLRAEGRHVASDTHELGWLISRSKEYVEFYCDEEFKATLLRWLKGSSSDTEEGLLKQLKATAVRVEVRHFDGYSAVADLIKNPRRTGMALVARELALAKTGKYRIFWHLIRVTRCATVFLTAAPTGEDARILRDLYTHARQDKLFRLADAALSALARVDPPGAEAACRECVALPLGSKVLAISSLHILRDLNPGLLEESATRLLASQDDPYVSMNALEAISLGPTSASGELAKALLARLSLSSSREVRDAVAKYLGEKISLDITESLKDPALSGDDERRAAALSVLDRRITAGLVANRDGTVEFLYRILRGEHEPSRRSAALMLYKLGDDYAPKVLNDFLSSDGDETVVDVLRRLIGALKETLLPSLGALLPGASTPVQETLRALLAASTDPGLREKTLATVFALRRDSPDEEDDLPLPVDGAAVALHSERSTYQFERENVQELVMFFSDIKGYSKKAQILTPMQLSSLLQEYEKILLSHVEGHAGELIKRMGDGHMIVFQRPLDAVLAAIRLQKSLRRFNRYRDENNQAVIRIGIHSGKVVRKEQGDVLGNAVNIASRLESSAQPGSILISDAIFEKVKDSVHAREIGHITVKNITGAIKVFEPYEIVIDLPAELDPLKRVRSACPEPAAARAPSAAPGAENMVSLDRAACAEIGRCFSALAALCRGADGGKVTVADINANVLARWSKVRARLPASIAGAGAGAAGKKAADTTPAGATAAAAAPPAATG